MRASAWKWWLLTCCYSEKDALNDKRLLFCFPLMCLSEKCRLLCVHVLRACDPNNSSHVFESCPGGRDAYSWLIFRSKTLSLAHHNCEGQTEAFLTDECLSLKYAANQESVLLPRLLKRRLTGWYFHVASLKNNQSKLICVCLCTWFNIIKEFNENDPPLWYSFPNDSFIEILMKTEEKRWALTSAKGSLLK